MQRAYWRSLDHQSASVKSIDKKSLTAKQIQGEVQSKFEEGKNFRKSGFQVPKYQVELTFYDSTVIADATHLLLTFIDRNSAGFGDTQKAMVFVSDFIPVFFGMERSSFQEYMDLLSNEHSPAEELDDESMGGEGNASPRSRKEQNKKKMELLGAALGRPSENPNHGDKENTARGSRGGTPDAVFVPSAPIPDLAKASNSAELKWMEHPGQGNFNMQREYTLNEAYPKKDNHLYANTTLYCFVRSFEVLYARLLRIKQHEEDAHEDVRRGLAMKPADELSIVDKSPTDFFYDCDPKANLYRQVLQMCEEVVKGDMEMQHLEETLRRFYLRSGHLLYQLEKILGFIAKFAGAIFSGDSRDRCADIVNFFFKEQEKSMTTHNQEIQYRKQVERLVKDGDVYRVSYVSIPADGWRALLTECHQDPATKKATVRLMTPEDATLEKEDLSEEARWSYYVSAYTMRDPTEGIPFSQMHMPFLKRNLPAKLDEEEEYNRYYRRLVHHDGLIIRICAKSYHILYEPGSYDWWWRPTGPSEESAEEAGKDYTTAKERRQERFTKKFINNPKWAHGISKDKVDESNQRFRNWIKGAQADKDTADTAKVTEEADAAKPNEDAEMADAERTEETREQ